MEDWKMRMGDWRLLAEIWNLQRFLFEWVDNLFILFTMKTYSLDLRQRLVDAVDGGIDIYREIAEK